MAPTSRKQEASKATPKGKANAAHGLRDLFEVGLKDIYYAEQILSLNLPKMMKNASTPELVKTLKNHLTETNEHVSRLEKIFEVTGIKPSAKKCDAMEGILKESDALISKTDVGVVRDASIIASEQKAKHYEIATYGTLHAFAKTLGETKAANLLAISLEQEKKADAALTGIAITSINPKAFKADSIINPRL
jgi:ferritin-like metal-binding protein YciE